MAQHRRQSSMRAEILPPEQPKRFMGTFQLRSARYPWGKAAAASLSMGICILLGAIAGHVDWGLIATVGGFTSLYVHNEPYAQRAVKLVVIGSALAASLALGTLSAPYTWSMALTLGVVSMAATFFAGAYRIPPPSGYFFILVCALGTGLPVDPGSAPLRFGLALIGVAVAWVISMVGWIRHPHRPETSAVMAAFREVAVFLGASDHADKAQHNAALALRASEAAVTGARQVHWRQPGTSYRLYMLHERLKALFMAGISIAAEGKGPIHPGLSGAVIGISRAITDSTRAEGLVVPQPGLNTPARWRAHRELEQAQRIAATPPNEFSPGFQPSRRRVKDVLSGALDRRSGVVENVLRMGLVVVLATVIAHLLGNPRPYWVPLTCASVLQGVTQVGTLQRTIQRALGTTIGVILGSLIMAVHPPVAVMIVALMGFQWLAELLIVRNYGLAMVVITPLPLILAEAGFPGLQPAFLVHSRLEDTLLGCVIGVIGVLVLWRRASSQRLPHLAAQALRLEGALLLSAALVRQHEATVRHEATPKHEVAVKHDLVRQKNALQGLLLNLRTTYDAAVSEIPRAKPVLEGFWPIMIAVTRLGYSIVSISEHPWGDAFDFRGRAQEENAQETPEPKLEITKMFEDLATAIQRDQKPSTKQWLDIPGFPAISEDWQTLQEALQSAARTR